MKKLLILLIICSSCSNKITPILYTSEEEMKIAREVERIERKENKFCQSVLVLTGWAATMVGIKKIADKQTLIK